jgi:hypothetical protein
MQSGIPHINNDTYLKVTFTRAWELLCDHTRQFDCGCSRNWCNGRLSQLQNSSFWESGQIRYFALAARGMQSYPHSPLQHIQTSCNSLRFGTRTTIYHLHSVDLFIVNIIKLGAAATRTLASGMISHSARQTWVTVVWNIATSVTASSTFCIYDVAIVATTGSSCVRACDFK